MRKSEREIKTEQRLGGHDGGVRLRIGLFDNGMPYVVPMSFGRAKIAFISTAQRRDAGSTSSGRTTGSVSRWTC